ncbi:MAG: RNA-dependent DNA polymerase [Rhodospirillales bacterium]|nr:RNA-dependent DNA polymerase [Rhodospirillales bacterium]
MKAAWSLSRLEKAWYVIRENARTSKSEDVRQEVERFGEDASRNLRSLSSRLSKGTFVFPPAKGVPVPKRTSDGRKTGKFRPIVLASVESRIVQRSILDVLLGVERLKPYAENPHSFGGIRKGEEGLGAVPAAIYAVLAGIGAGAKFVAVADISSFFTRISKDAVTQIIHEATHDDAFTDFFRSAINVELSNLAELREKAEKFPTHDIGVAQGNSLSPLLGNIILHDFDRQMNEGDCRCLRYIDDFIILAPNTGATKARMRKAIKILGELGMVLSPEKSSGGPISISDDFEFLGIELNNGFIRPSRAAQEKLLTKVQGELDASIAAFRKMKSGQPVAKSNSLISTLKRVDGIVQGWGKHYRFCNDERCFANLDIQIAEKIRKYLGAYSSFRRSADDVGGRVIFGLEQLALIDRSPFLWPQGTAPLLEPVPAP